MGWVLRGGAMLAAASVAYSCLARDEGSFEKQYADDAGPPGAIEAGPSVDDAKGELPDIDPHGVQGVDPPHGSWAGGQLALVRGNGFSSEVRVWFGSIEVPATDLVPIDAKRVQVTVPGGAAGAVDVRVQNASDESTSRTVLGGYTYDDFFVEPASGPTSGGTQVTLQGSGTNWTDGTEVLIDLVPCANVVVVSKTELRCTTPAAPPGAKLVRVTTPDKVDVDVLEAFTYGNSDNGFRGGLSGQPLNGKLRVLALDAFTGDPIPAAFVVAGNTLESALVAKTDGAGVVDFQDAGLSKKRSVTVAKKCNQPITFVDVPVDTVTAYLDPILSPTCAEDGDPPPTGGSGSLSGSVSGELLWPKSKEFERAGWTNVPLPKGANESHVAYVFPLAPRVSTDFQLPGAFSAITPDSPGTIGFSYGMSTSTGNKTFYALAGIEDRSVTPPKFIAYAMGIVKGVPSIPGVGTNNIYIEMDIPLDHALTVSANGPSPTTKGPDRLLVASGVAVGELGFVILPNAEKSGFLPGSSKFSFVGLPPLVGALSGTNYVVAARAVTGKGEATPESVATELQTNTTSAPLTISGFVEIPSLNVPKNNTLWNDRDLSVSFKPGGVNVDLTVITMSSLGGLSNWTIAAPAGVGDIQLPALAVLDAKAALPSGPLTVAVSLANIANFDYGSLRYRQLAERGWSAHATDVFFSHH